jgi:hypothetical protein
MKVTLKLQKCDSRTLERQIKSEFIDHLRVNKQINRPVNTLEVFYDASIP